VTNAAKKLGQLKDLNGFGSWQLVSIQELDPYVREMLEIAGYFAATYVHQSTGKRVQVSILVGPRGPLCVEVPQIVVASRGPFCRRWEWDLPEFGRFRGGTCRAGRGSLQCCVYRAFRTGGRWEARAFRFAGPQYLYKIQVSCSRLGEADQDAADACGEFLESFLPVAKKYMVKLPGHIARLAPYTTDAELEKQIRRLGILESLSLSGTGITNAGLKHIKGLGNLTELSLWSTQVTDGGLEQINGLSNLRVLWVSDTKITDAGLEHIKGLTSLRTVYLHKTQVTSEGVKKLREALPECEIVY
jgi:hypothetical protein